MTGGTEHGYCDLLVGCVEQETRRIREMVEATTAEARSVRGDVESRVATLAAAADANAVHALPKKSRVV